jgi:hypothetical protein
MTTKRCSVKAGGTIAISGSRPWTLHADRFYRESAVSLGSLPVFTNITSLA